MKILFIDQGNVARSRMAAYFFNSLSKRNSAISAGIEAAKWNRRPIGEFATPLVKCMNEEGYDLSKDVPTQLTPVLIQGADMIISFEEEKDLPEYLQNSREIRFWNCPNPKGESYPFHIDVRDRIKNLVQELITKVG